MKYAMYVMHNIKDGNKPDDWTNLAKNKKTFNMLKSLRKVIYKYLMHFTY